MDSMKMLELQAFTSCEKKNSYYEGGGEAYKRAVDESNPQIPICSKPGA